MATYAEGYEDGWKDAAAYLGAVIDAANQYASRHGMSRDEAIREISKKLSEETVSDNDLRDMGY